MNDLEFEKLYEKYKKLIHRIIYEFNVPSYTKEDLLQEALMCLYQSHASFDPSRNTKFITYFYVMLKNRIYKLISANVKHDYVLKNWDDKLFSELPSEYADKGFENEVKSDINNALLNELNNLPRGDISYDIIFNDMRQREVAEKHNISQQMVSRIHNKNIKYLHKKLANMTGGL